jgi:hypothetical protein
MGEKLLIDCGHKTNIAIGHQWMIRGTKYTWTVLAPFYSFEWFVDYHFLKLLGRSTHVHLRDYIS